MLQVYLQGNVEDGWYALGNIHNDCKCFYLHQNT